jgi:hypothetical protein
VNSFYSPLITCPAGCDEGTVYAKGPTPFADVPERCDVCNGHGEVIQIATDDPLVVRAMRHMVDTEGALKKISGREPINADHAKWANYDAFVAGWALARLATLALDIRSLTVGYEPEPRVLKEVA